MDEFLIKTVDGSGGLLFYQRSPVDCAEPIEDFWVRVTDQNLSAAARVYAGYAPSQPSPLFKDIAQHWSGWAGEKTWESLERELALRCSHDRFGHISIGVEIRTYDWRVSAKVIAEAGQLDSIADGVAAFFGRLGNYV